MPHRRSATLKTTLLAGLALVALPAAAIAQETSEESAGQESAGQASASQETGSREPAGETAAPQDETASDREIIATVTANAGDIEVEKLASLRFPWAMAYLPDGRLLVTEKPGALRIYEDGTLSDPVSGLPEIAYRNQGGLLDVAVDPDFADNRRIYLYYVRAAETQPEDAEVDADPRLGPYVDEADTTAKHGVVIRAELDDMALTGIEEIWRQSENVVGLGHYGGRLVFAPDGKLIITSGERQKFTPAQDEDSNLGKVIRINADGSIPEDNPFAGEPAPRNAVWSTGHRNPLGADIRPDTGTLYIHEMGPLYGDELNVPEAGKDYGWPSVSNGEHYNRVEIPHHETRPEEFVRPVFYWRPAISPSGLEFYTGDMFADWKSNAFIGGLSTKALIRLAFDGENVSEEEQIDLNMRIRDVETARDGAILLLTDAEDGALLRLTPARKD